MGFLDKMRVGTPATATDPVCHMKVDPAKPPGGFSELGTQTYYFCSAGCKKKFDAEPAKFIGPEGAGGAHHMH
ncbi:MAG TPA: YHS domain-containing protein [Candidatus Thermoplasmatota archaeon]|nr:YHS domain-containing protein [Candidatus Thermoplasmatota archaeon]